MTVNNSPARDYCPILEIRKVKVREITKFVQLVNKAGIKIQFQCNSKCHNNFKTQYYLSEGSRASQSQEVSDMLLRAMKPTENWLDTCSCLALLVLYTMHSINKYWESTMWQPTKNSKIKKNRLDFSFLTLELKAIQIDGEIALR